MRHINDDGELHKCNIGDNFDVLTLHNIILMHWVMCFTWWKQSTMEGRVQEKEMDHCRKISTIGEETKWMRL